MNKINALSFLFLALFSFTKATNGIGLVFEDMEPKAKKTGWYHFQRNYWKR
jgi:hypothetical protein